MFDIPGMGDALRALEAQRKRDLEDWMDEHGYDVVVFQAQGDVGKANVDTNAESAEYALRNGMKYSNGNRAIMHMGVPTVSVAMGVMEENGMPVNLTFAGKAGSDVELLRYACAYEHKSQQRVAPQLTPELPTDEKTGDYQKMGHAPPVLEVQSSYVRESDKLTMTGQVASDLEVEIEAYVNGKPVAEGGVKVDSNGDFTVEADFEPYQPKKALYGGNGKDVEQPMIVLLARSKGGVVGHLTFATEATS
ncbi:hypothetical protein LTS18_005467 [Coniosporium uncinatum]|uniref:Uncharacterized protein n=1 Tax=Coniosporium uncinatum TaxID=93489 RepID=A0ACC3DYW6_9PEZI|nr:hypothetical protein LTS18_005467 [Coniosporium uncinatum]